MTLAEQAAYEEYQRMHDLAGHVFEDHLAIALWECFRAQSHSDPDLAYSIAQSALEMTTGKAQLWPQYRQVLLRRHFGEDYSAYSLLKNAQRFIANIDWHHDYTYADATGLLHFVIEASHYDIELARMILGIHQRARPNLPEHREVLVGLEDFAMGMVAKSAGRFDECIALIESSLAAATRLQLPAYRSLGNIQLQHAFFLQSPGIAERLASTRSPKSLRVRAQANPQHAFNPLFLTLSAAPREVLWLLLQGRSRKDIALITHRSLSTINSHVATLYATFDVHSNRELIAACSR